MSDNIILSVSNGTRIQLRVHEHISFDALVESSGQNWQ
jgi:hypothetical protein